MYPEFEW
jgi:hypothetical protein